MYQSRKKMDKDCLVLLDILLVLIMELKDMKLHWSSWKKVGASAYSAHKNIWWIFFPLGQIIQCFFTKIFFWEGFVILDIDVTPCLGKCKDGFDISIVVEFKTIPSAFPQVP